MTLNLMCFYLLLVEPLFSLGIQLIKVVPGSDRSLSTFKACQDKFQVSCHKATIDLDALDTDDSFEFPGNVAMFKTWASEEGGFITYGFRSSSGLESAVITRSLDRSETEVLASVSLADGSRFQLSPTGGQGQVWVTLSPNLPPEGRVADTLQDKPQTRVDSMRNQDGTVEFSITVYYTQEFSDTLHNPSVELVMHAAQMVALINEGFINTKVDIKAKLHCVSKYPEQEKHNLGPQLEAFHKWQDISLTLKSADIAFLLTSDGDYCSMSFLHDPLITLAIIHKACMFNTYSAAHALGHMFGMVHNREHEERKSYYPYGHGYLITRPPANQTFMGYQTIMGEPHANHYIRVNYYSNDDPSITYDGRLTGDADNNNRRVLLERVAKYYSSIGDEDTSACDSPLNPRPSPSPPPPPSPPLQPSPLPPVTRQQSGSTIDPKQLSTLTTPAGCKPCLQSFGPDTSTESNSISIFPGATYFYIHHFTYIYE